MADAARDNCRFGTKDDGTVPGENDEKYPPPGSKDAAVIGTSKERHQNWNPMRERTSHDQGSLRPYRSRGYRIPVAEWSRRAT